LTSSFPSEDPYYLGVLIYFVRWRNSDLQCTSARALCSVQRETARATTAGQGRYTTYPEKLSAMMQKQRDIIPVPPTIDLLATFSFFILIQKLCHLYQKRFPFSRFFLPKPEAAQARSGRNAACLNGQSERDARRSGATKEEESKAGAIIWSSNVAATRATTRASVICASAVPAPSAAVRWEERRERGSEAETTTTTGNALWAGARHRAMHPSLTIAFAAKLNNLMVRVVSRYCSGPDCGRPRT
jgi:hypothetical protein